MVMVLVAKDVFKGMGIGLVAIALLPFLVVRAIIG